ncbi:hypothetical protein FOWG_03340 [Fusarium oxysporum f. sp. lycopersici MN25]|nr:hypothetical protein FOWG_03340 [Fusarium oxysporum f. sp. lycopersici MN25]
MFQDSHGSQDQSSTNDRPTEIELQSRATTQATAMTERRDKMKSLESPQAEVCDDQTSTSQYSFSELPGSLEQISNQATDASVRDMASTNQSVQLHSNRASLSQVDQLEADAAVAAQCISSQDTLGENECLSPQVERRLLNAIRDKILSMLGTTMEGHRAIFIYDLMSTKVRFQFSVNETVDLVWRDKAGTLEGIEAARVEQAIREAWPKSRNVSWVKQNVVESDGRNPAVEVPWPSVAKVYQDERNAIERNPFDTIRWRGITYSGYESLWHSWCLAARRELEERLESQTEEDDVEIPTLQYRPKGKIIYCSSHGRLKGMECFPIEVFACALSFDEPFSTISDYQRSCEVGYSASFFTQNFQGEWSVDNENLERDSIHWQIRYFRPVAEIFGSDTNCVLSKRQTATIRHGSKAICLEEKRARISFRVLTDIPDLFSILVLSDELISPKIDLSDGIGDVSANWERYGLKARERAIPITHYLYEICRVFEICMYAWGQALDVIDGLVHVDLDDFDDQSRVDDLMFDKSFDLSKDYFVALQLLRIVDEWLEEVVPSLKELQKHPSIGRVSFCAVEAKENFNAAIRLIDERAGAVQRRVRKKVEEINSLRDGVGS